MARFLLLFGLTFGLCGATVLACSSSSSSDDSAGPTSDAGSGSDVTVGKDTGAPGDGGLAFATVTEVGRAGGIVVEKVSYLSDGLLVNGQICRPDDAVAHPVLVFNHGGFAGLTTELFAGDVNAAGNFCTGAAKNGYVVMESSYRGEDGSQGSVEVCLGEVDDVVNMLAIVRAQPYAIASRVAALGGSHGGCITDQLALRDPTLKAAVDDYGPTDWAALDTWWHSQIDQNEPAPFCANPDGGMSPCLAVHQLLIADVEPPCGGTPAAVPDAYAKRSTATKLSTLTVPIAIFQGTADALVDLTEVCTKRTALGPVPTFYFDATLTQQNPSDVCGGGFTTTPPPNGQTAADWPENRYIFIFEGQGHGFTGDGNTKASTLALEFILSRL